MVALRRGGLVLALVLGAACATPQTDRVLAGRSERTARVQLREVPFHAQRTDHCGPASLAMVLNWGGDPITPDELAPQVFTPGREGTLQSDIVAGARRRERVPYVVSGLDGLLAEVEGGHPVLVFQNLGLSWYPVWHFAVAIGYDLERGTILLHSGREAGREISLRVFERTWRRADGWALAVLPPDVLPARAREDRYLDAVLGLEQDGHWRAAETAYATALERWPASLGAWMGLGNARYAQGELAGAEQAFRTAAELHPDAGPAFNNLAQVLAERGRREEARAAIGRALEIGGPLEPTYRNTLQEIEQRAEERP